MAVSNPHRSYELARGEGLDAGLTRVAAGRAEKALERLRASSAGEVATGGVQTGGAATGEVQTGEVATGGAETGGAETGEAVHGARKDMKKLRTVLRLLRAELGPKRYRRADARIRDAGRALAAGRDSEVKLVTLDSLAADGDALPAEAVDAWRKILERDRAAAADAPSEARAIGEAISLLEAGLEELNGWELEGDRWKPVGAGLRRTHRRGRRAMEAARRDRGEADFHEWRKRTKDLWYELRLLAPAWPGPLGAAAEEAHALSEQLGDHHDLAVLREDLRERNLGEAETAALEAAISRRQEELAAAALPLGRRLYAERPREFSRRLHRYWQAWRFSEPEVGKGA